MEVEKISINKKIMNLTTYNHLITGVEQMHIQISKRGYLTNENIL